MKHLPIALILFRLSLAPTMIIVAQQHLHNASVYIVVMLFAGLLSDIFDGIVARNVGVSTTKLRRMDSQTDMLFWLSAGIASWLIWPEVIRQHRLAIFALLGMEVACYAVSLIKFRRETCTHAYLSKLWGLTLLAAFTDLVLYGRAETCFYVCLTTGVVSHLDRILITLLLPEWTHDIPSAYHAWRIRKGLKIKRFGLFNG